MTKNFVKYRAHRAWVLRFALSARANRKLEIFRLKRIQGPVGTAAYRYVRYRSLRHSAAEP